MNKIITVVSLVMVGMLLAVMVVGCAGGESEKPLPATIELVPSGVDLVAEVKISEILEDPSIAGNADIVAELDALEEEIGFDLRDFEEGVVFSNIAQTIDDEAYIAGIVKGTFEEDSLLAAIGDMMDMTLDSVDHKNYKIYADEIQDFALAFLSDGVFVFGTIQTVKDVIDVREGDKSSVSGMVLDTYNELGNALIKVVWELPAEYVSQLSADALGDLLSGLPVDIAPLLHIEAVAFAYNTGEESSIVTVKLLYPTSDAVQQAHTTLNELVGILKIAVGSGLLPFEVDKEVVAIILDLIDKVEISASGSWLTISMEMTVAEIEDWMEKFQALE